MREKCEGHFVMMIQIMYKKKNNINMRMSVKDWMR